MKANTNLIVDMPLKHNLVDNKRNLTGGDLSRVSAATLIGGGGGTSPLHTAWGDRTQLINTSAQNDLTTWWTLVRAANSTAGAFVADANNNTHYIYRASLMSDGVTYVLSLKAKAGAVNFIALSVNTDDPGFKITWFDLVNGTVGTDGVDYSGISGPDSDGYYRCYIVQTVTDVSVTNGLAIYAADEDGTSGNTFAGDNSSVSVYVKEIMFEALPSGNVIGDDLFDQETLGSELLTNGDFANWTADDPDDWSVDNEDANNYVTESSGAAQLVSDNSAILALYQSWAATIGTVYKITFDITVNTLGWRFLVQGGGYSPIPIANYTTSGSKTFYCIATHTTMTLYFYRHNGGSSDYTVDNVSIKAVTAPAKGIPVVTGGLEAALAGAEAITAQNDRDFSSGTIGNWVVAADGAGTCTYSTADLDGVDDKQGLLTSSGDTTLYALLPTTAMSISALTLYRCSVRLHVPSANTLKNVRLSWDFAGEIPSIVTATLAADTYTEVVGYFYLPATVVGNFAVGFNGDPADGDLLYFDDISIRPVQISWGPFGTNTIEIDETEDALKVTYVDNGGGAYLYLSDANDLSSDLTVGETYLLQLDAKVGSGDTVRIDLESTPDIITGNIAEAWTTYKLIFIADHATDVWTYMNLMGAGEVIYIRNMSLKPIPDLALLEPSDYVNSATISAKPRFEANGLLVEGEATNLLDYSEDFVQWSKSNLTATLGSVTDPRGATNTSCGFQADATADEIRFRKYTVTSVAADNTVHCLSCFLKAGTSTWASLWIEGKDDLGHAQYYNLTGDGAVGTGVNATTSGIEYVGGGWYRCWVSGDIASGAIPLDVRIYSASADGVQSLSATLNDYVLYAYGAQLEPGRYPTSYIPTDGCPVTRTSEAADGTYGFTWDVGATLQGILSSGTIAGTLIVEITPKFSAADGSGTASAFINFVSATSTSLLYYDFTNTDLETYDGTTAATVDESLVLGTTYQIVVRWSDASNKLIVSNDQGSQTWEHGTAQALDADGFVITGNKMYLAYSNEYPFNIKNLKIYDAYLTDTEVSDELWKLQGITQTRRHIPMTFSRWGRRKFR